MEKGSYSPRLTFIILISLIIGQVLIVNYLKSDFDKQLTACYEAINTSSIIQGALVNMLVQKNIIDRDQLMKEAGTLSTELSAKLERMKQQQKEGKDTAKNAPGPPPAEGKQVK